MWDEKYFEAGASDGWNIRMRNQPANSPKVNVCDLGIFNTAQSFQQEECAVGIKDFVKNVEKSFEEEELISMFYNFIAI